MFIPRTNRRYDMNDVRSWLETRGWEAGERGGWELQGVVASGAERREEEGGGLGVWVGSASGFAQVCALADFTPIACET
jgi:hypothetical protein